MATITELLFGIFIVNVAIMFILIQVATRINFMIKHDFGDIRSKLFDIWIDRKYK